MQLRPKGATITRGGGQTVSGRLCVKLTWAEEDVKSWHSKSAHSAENTSMAPVRPQSPDDAGEMGRIPGLPSATGLSFTSRRAAAEWLPLVPDKPEPPGEGAELRLEDCARG